MHLTVTVASTDAVFPLELPDDPVDLATLKAFCQAHSDIPAEEMVVVFNGKAVEGDEKKAISEFGIKDGEMILIERKRKKKTPASTPTMPGGLQLPDFSQIKVPGSGGGGAAAGPSSSSSSSAASGSRFVVTG